MSMVLTGNSMEIAVKFWDKCCIENANFNATLIPNFTATHAITSTYLFIYYHIV